MRPFFPAGVAVVLLGLGMALQHPARPQSPPAPPPQPSEPAEPLGSAWSRALSGVEGLALSPEGERVVTVGGGVRSLSRDGRVLWELDLEGVDSAVVARRGQLTVAYTRRRPLYRKVYFLGPEGRRLGILEPTEPIEAAAVSPDGRYAALAAGRSVIFCTLTGKGIQHRVLPLAGHPEQVEMGPDDSVYVACRSRPYVALVKSSGKELWRREQPDGEAYAISASADGRSVAVSTQLPRDTIRTALLTSRNAARWTDVRPGRRPRPRLSASGTAVALSYELRVESPRGVRFERRLTYLAHGAAGAWPKGGPFSAPLHVALAEDGDWLVALDTQRRNPRPSFRLFGRGGERRWLFVSRSPILIARSSQDGRSVATYRVDGYLELLRVAAP